MTDKITVKELTEILSGLPDDSEVLVYRNHGYVPIDSISYDFTNKTLDIRTED